MRTSKSETSNPSPTLAADLFCQVVDNLGDIGVMWRLARQLTTEKNWTIRLWVDRLESFKTIAPQIDPSLPIQTCNNIEVRQWPKVWQPTSPHQVVIAGFSCELPDDYLKLLAGTTNPAWLQLEYLSAQDWVSSFHGLHSKRNDALKPVFFFPGFNEQTGGLIREFELIEQRNHWIAQQEQASWLASIGISIPSNTRLVSVFTYPHAPLHLLIDQLEQTGERFHLVMPSTLPSSTRLPKSEAGEQITWQAIEFLTQPDYDKLLWASDLNLVRGEDSFVRAIWAGKPMLWQIYPQKDGVHHPKLDAWLSLADLPISIGQAMHEWADGNLATDLTPWLTDHGWQAWQQASQALCGELAKQSDLATRLDAWVRTQTSTTNGL
ncbi:MAG: elongation factor P maturation arginine rhamnosyltransferase EarP [Burkholderiaceae bacterium]|nr:elongation factor P maturation arginine rhamnosyltransferase EarP [Burkholderiaceae bacterium]